MLNRRAFLKLASAALAGMFAPRGEVVQAEDPYERRWVEDVPAQEAVVVGQCPLVVDNLCSPGCDCVENGWNGDSESDFYDYLDSVIDDGPWYLGGENNGEYEVFVSHDQGDTWEKVDA